MKDTFKFALSCLLMYGASILIALLFSSLVAAENLAASIFGTASTLLVLFALGFFEGGTRGEADSSYAKRLRDREAERGVVPTAAELQKCYYPWKGIVAGLIAMSPIILFSIFMLFKHIPKSDFSWAQASAQIMVYPITGIGPTYTSNFFWGTAVMRILMFPYFGIFAHFDVSQTWIYLPLILTYPGIIALGYWMGPRRFAKLLKQLHDNEMKRKRRKKKKQRIA